MNVDRLLRELAPVLGFDPYEITPTQEDEVRRAVDVWLEDTKIRRALMNEIDAAASRDRSKKNARTQR